MRTKIKTLLAQSHADIVGKPFTIKGWIKTVRSQKTNTFIEVNDGSCFTNLQVVIDPNLQGYDKLVTGLATGVAVEVTGPVVESPGQNQNVEMHPEKLEIIGTIDPEHYPLQKSATRLSFCALLLTCARVQTPLAPLPG